MYSGDLNMFKILLSFNHKNIHEMSVCVENPMFPKLHKVYSNFDFEILIPKFCGYARVS